MRLSDSGLAGAMACRPSTFALLHHRMSPGVSLVALPQRSSARFTSILCSASPRPCLNVVSIHALDPDFYKIPYVDGIPVGKRLKLWNLPPNCKHSELLEWFAGVDVVVESLELTDDPVLNAQGIGGFVEFATKQHACIAIVRLDGYKFRGHYIRMDFAEKRPRPNYGSRRSRPNQNSSSRGSFARPLVTDIVPSNGGTASSSAPFTSRYEDANVKPSSDLGIIVTTAAAGPQSSSSSGESIQHNPASYSSTNRYEDADVKPSSDLGIIATAADEGPQSSSSNGERILHNPASSSSTKASPGPGASTPASSYGDSRQVNSGVQERSPTGAVGHISSQTRAVQGYSPSSPYAGYCKLDPYDDPFKNYGAPDKAVVEPWSGKSSFRSGPMYGSPQPSSLNRLFVGNLALSVEDATLQQLFSRFGTVLEARVLREPESGRSRGFGIVAMSSLEEVKAAFEALDGLRVESRPLRVEAVALKH